MGSERRGISRYFLNKIFWLIYRYWLQELSKIWTLYTEQTNMLLFYTSALPLSAAIWSILMTQYVWFLLLYNVIWCKSTIRRVIVLHFLFRTLQYHISIYISTLLIRNVKSQFNHTIIMQLSFSCKIFLTYYCHIKYTER